MPVSVAGRTAERLIQGTAMLDGLPQKRALALLDGVAEAGCTTFDLAENYGRGSAERIFGAWLAQHPTAPPPFVITKGGHPYEGRDRIGAAEVRADLEGSLARLGLDAVDLYLLHRDDPRVPVDEIVSFLEAFRADGHVRAYGVSNWSAERVRAAQAYAQRHGLPGLAASSPHFSLAVPNESPWPGCVSIAGPDAEADRAYYAASGPPVLAWSSLAMGYFVLDQEGEPDDPARSLATRVFASPANAARRARAHRLARAEGSEVTPLLVRYALSQPMDLHALVGCRTPAEYRALRDAVRRPLTPAQCAWLEDGGTDAPPAP